MALDYRSADFWKKFRSRYWEPRVPVVIRQPFRNFPFSEQVVARALNEFVAGLRGGDHRISCLLSIDDTETAPRRPLRELFATRRESLADLEKACGEVFSGKSFGLMVSHLQAVDPDIWNGLTTFLQDASPWLGPLPRAFLDFFWGNYSTSFTGVHKDTQEIFAFVVRGEKRILAWPFDYFLSRAKGVGPAARYFNMRLAVDARKYRKDALVLDAQAGDVIYWPSDYWHVAEPRSRRFSAMLSLGVLRPTIPPKPVPDMASYTHRQLRWVTGYGFELGGPRRDTLPPLPAKAIVKRAPNALLYWKTSPDGRRLLVATNGHSVTLPHSPRLVRLLERLSRGESVRPPPPSARASRGSIIETYWSRHCELKTRKRTADRDAAAWLVRWLLGVYAAES